MGKMLAMLNRLQLELCSATAKISIRSHNTKLGRIPNHSLPAFVSCPGATDSCRGLNGDLECYGCNFGWRGSVAKNWLRNYLASQGDTYTLDLYRQVMKVTKGVGAYRLHPVGDIYSANYCRALAEVARLLPNVQFFGYTRSWRIPGLVPALRELASLPNVKLYASIDNACANEVVPDFMAAGEACKGAPMRPASNGKPWMQCPESTGRYQTCEECKLCYRAGVNVNPWFPEH